MKKTVFVIIALLAVILVSCRQVDSGTVTITNALPESVRVHFSQNYESEIITVPAISSVSRRFEVYHSAYPEDKIPRCTFTKSGSDYSIFSITSKNYDIYVTNTYGSDVVLLNSFESDTNEYPILTGASNQLVNIEFCERVVLALKTIPAENYILETKNEYDKTYLLIRRPGF